MYTRVSPSLCLGFILRWQKIRENTSHLDALHVGTNPTVYLLSQSVQSPGRRSITKLTEILLHRFTRASPIHPVNAWVLFQGEVQGKMHPTLLIDMTKITNMEHF